jgi:hypothetical protein
MIEQMKIYSGEELQPLIDAMVELFFNFGPIFDFSHLEPNQDNLEKICVMLRVTCRGKHVITGYDDCLQRCIKECDRLNVDKNDILYGMI